ncbi:hypothetical protein D3C77_574410 [compost metagenome]
MEREFRLLDSDVLDKEHFPITAFFNSISDSDFIETIKNLSLGIGVGINATVCLFPDDLDPDEEKFEGIMFSLHDDEVIVDYQTFLYYLEKACSVFIEVYPDKKSIIDTCRDKVKNRFGSGT